MEDTLTGFFFFKEHKKYHAGAVKWSLSSRVLANGINGMDQDRVKDKAIGQIRKL